MNRTLLDRQYRKAFSLIELLVVIGIIALLLAILMPALVQMRSASQQIKCQGNLRSLGELLILHANDHQGYLPLAGNISPGKTTMGTDDPISLGDPAQRKYVYYENTPGVHCVTALPAAMARYIIGRPARSDSWMNVDADIQSSGPLQDAFICPSDLQTIDRTYGSQVWINNYGSATFLNGWSSYGVNAEIFAWTDAGVGGTAGHSRLRGKLAAVPHSSQTMLMCDTNAAIEVWVLGANLSLADVYLGTGGTVGSGVFDRHRHHGRMNILFADGHVDAVGILGADGLPSAALAEVSIDKDFR